MSQIINSTSSEYDMPTTNPYAKQTSTTIYSTPFTSSTDKICNTCIKEDVCSIKGECIDACKRITQISKEENTFLDTTKVCRKWASKPSGNIR